MELVDVKRVQLIGRVFDEEGFSTIQSSTVPC